ncbi:hypothetical protein SAZ11_30520 [Streptomyces sp. FXJ1.4098]|nr:hypothetical protein [Streptomyces sp. FXJ1.4098]
MDSRRRAASHTATVSSSPPHARTNAARSCSRGRSSRLSAPEMVARGSTSPAASAFRSSWR